MAWYSLEPKTVKYVKRYEFLSFAKKYNKYLLDNNKYLLKTDEFLGNEIADAVTKENDDEIVKQEPVEETITPPEERAEILNKLR